MDVFGGSVGIAIGVGVVLVVAILIGLAIRSRGSTETIALTPRAVVREPDPFTEGSATEKRRALRRRGRRVRVLVTDADGKAEPIEGFVLDRSVNGLRLSVGNSIPEGTPLRIC